MSAADELTNPTVQALVTAINAGDRESFFATLAAGATLSDDGIEHDLVRWADQEIFSANGQMVHVLSQSAEGTSLVADYRNDIYGTMRTAWTFTVTDGKISRIEAGQA